MDRKDPFFRYVMCRSKFQVSSSLLFPSTPSLGIHGSPPLGRENIKIFVGNLKDLESNKVTFFRGEFSRNNKVNKTNWGH